MSDVNILLFDRPPQPLNKNIIQTATPTVHADFNISFNARCREFRTGEMAALIGIENFRDGQGVSPFLNPQAEINVQRVRQFPGDDIARVPVDNSCQITEAMFQFDVGNIGAPNLVRPENWQPAEQIRIDLVLFVRLAQISLFLRVNGGDAHFNHQGSDMLFSDRNLVVAPDETHDRPLAVGRILGVYLVNQIHDEQIPFTDSGFVIQAGTGYVQEFSLTAQRDVMTFSVGQS